jgi:CDP-glycerol:poly(glycerophosphate) glycerophosphotransferase
VNNYLFYISENYSFQILRPLQKEIIRRGDQVKWFIDGDNVNKNYFKADESVLKNIHECIAYNPIAVFVPGNMVPSFIPGLKVQVFHGFVGWKTRKKDNINYHFIIRDCFDLYCTHGATSTEPFNELKSKHQTFEVIETGWCKLDPYFSESTTKSDSNSNKPVVLFSSTFSPRLTKAQELKEKILALSLSGKYQWLVTFHPKMDRDIVNAYKKIQHEHLTFIETDDLVPYMQKADVMLGDYSSMMTDFLVLQKPVLTYKNPDFIKGLTNVDSLDELEMAIDCAIARPPEMMTTIKQYVQNAHPYNDGKSSERVLNTVEHMLCVPPKLKKKPLNIVRNFKKRYALNYWKFTSSF